MAGAHYEGGNSKAAAGPASGAVASAEAAARLARLEALTDKQLAEFSTAVRQIDKLQVRTRLTGGDIRRPLAQHREHKRGLNAPTNLSYITTHRCAVRQFRRRSLSEWPHSLAHYMLCCVVLTNPDGGVVFTFSQLQTAAADHSAVLVRLASEQEVLRGQLRDTQALLVAVQGLTAKQFQLSCNSSHQFISAGIVYSISKKVTVPVSC
ncbi:hypothetical protein VOLCADRAFT_93306 [Volvox carteri f. nagariensis]|uniref:Uncharacterized protein n=1 Tax=Volvox carteri f. nagariensis TaxID=3068 RepID=D8U1S8_VOLCA|nr:uncharacterized protein VOLCADRAFT_93306 [Volvox carteri f. nagariensis]EFJ46234.1 hypothetical protein VOLCADRAFT_93306 [Volvox carteri f. nagariensis]|eukprot:XP_002952681.1 hypothetical protein VOLCADRAFT_93306 [Volvox carteri f. nagariensis]